jgi:hypothetical protein
VAPDLFVFINARASDGPALWKDVTFVRVIGD